MEVKILQTEKNASHQRTKVMAEISYQGKTTPSRAVIQDNIAKKQKAEPELVIISALKAGFGATKAQVTAYIYDSKKAANLFEAKYMLKRNEIVKPQEEEKVEA